MASSDDFLWAKPAQLILLATTFWLLFHLGRGIYQAYFGPLHNVPGPKSWIIFTFIPKLKGILGTFDQDLRRFHQRYGPVVRYAPGSISFTTDEAWKIIYGPVHGQFEKYFLVNQIEPQSSIFTADDTNHARIRRGISHAFAPRSLAEQEPMIHNYIELLVQRLSDVAESRVPTEIGRWFHLTSFDIIADLATGESLGGLENNEFHYVVESVLRFVERGRILGGIDELLGPFAALVRPLIAPGVMQGFMNQYNHTRVAVGKRLEKGPDESRKDLLSGLLRGMGDKDIKSTEELITNANGIFVAGSDTTATLLTACTYYLLHTPHAHKKAVEEVRSAFASAADINFVNATARLPYMLAVLNETLRLYPPVPSAIERIVPNTEQPIHIDGVCVPPGTHVGVHQSSAGLSASNFAQPEIFAPERWLPTAAQDPSSPFFADKRSAMQPFSYGPRNCVGKHLAYNEMRVIMARLLWEFDMSLDPSSRTWTEPYSNHKSWVGTWKKPPLMIHLKKRPFGV
ncbi:benzoate 4-monooxygenase cytochrome P450 [Diaporthe helianthi]|uniref:Benzoate 4-monooxygenase cytochrome P450 n=1 Tax=Diaporthe helianthi TaxID=158607 RepID=A0A2P5HS99_DIAHE|nr:benzoate 4-monooxygenase cytochrome P450 [Diaporthe helianthi]